jgi:hypothetical protein
VPKLAHIHTGVQLAIHPREQIGGELRRDPGAVVVSRVENLGVLDEVDPQEEVVARCQIARHPPPERQRFAVVEVPDGGS